jgi:hypothetical protein
MRFAPYSLRPDQIRRALRLPKPGKLFVDCRSSGRRGAVRQAVHDMSRLGYFTPIRGYEHQATMVVWEAAFDRREEIKRVNYTAAIADHTQFNARVWNTARVAGYKGDDFKAAKIAAWRFLDSIVTKVSRA